MLTLFDETLNRPTEAGETNLRNLTVTPVTTTVTLNTLHHAVLESVVHERSPRTHNYGTTLTGPAIEVKEKDEPNLDLQWFTRSNALTAKLPILGIRKLIRD